MVLGRERILQLESRQQLCPSGSQDDCDLEINNRLRLRERVTAEDARLIRLHYDVDNAYATLAPGGKAPVAWPDAIALAGSSFEITLTERGPISKANAVATLPNRHAVWLAAAAEDVRSSWVVPPPDAVVDSTWLDTRPFGSSDAARVTICHRVESLDFERAVILGTVQASAEVADAGSSMQGSGQMRVSLLWSEGIVRCERSSEMQVGSQSGSKRLLRSELALTVE